MIHISKRGSNNRSEFKTACVSTLAWSCVNDDVVEEYSKIYLKLLLILPDLSYDDDVLDTISHSKT